MKIIPFCYTPSSFVDFVREHHAESNQLDWDACLVYVSLIWGNAGNNKRFKHLSKHDCFSIPAKLLTERLGRGHELIFKVINLIDIEGDYDIKKGETKPYRLSFEARELVMRYMTSDNIKTDILGIGRKPFALKTNNVNGIANAIKSRDKNNNNKKSKAYINPVVKINLNELEVLKMALIQYRDNAFHSIKPPAANDELIKVQPIIGIEEASKLDDWIERRLIATMQLIHMATLNIKLPSGQLIQYYVESGSGRIYGQDIHLQTAPREVRKAALAGQCDYDFDNCHYAILHQLASQQGVETPHIADYLAHKNNIRERLAKSLDVPIATIKECLIALIYGASIRDKPRLALNGILGSQGLNKLLRHRVFVGLYKDIKNAGKAVLVAHAGSGKLVNAMNKKLTDEKANSLCHILQGCEARMLNVAMDMHGSAISLLQHDGFTSSDLNIDLLALEAEIQKQTGLKITISKDVLKTSRMHSSQTPEAFAA
jgi:hypothetical protein